jgi:hypothetical protein
VPDAIDKKGNEYKLNKKNELEKTKDKKNNKIK